MPGEIHTTPPPSASHNNQQLFSDYYLDRKLPERDEWRALIDEAAPVRDALRALYKAYTPSGNEAQVEQDWVRPVLTALGHTFEVQAALETPEHAKRPDYILYPSATAVAANKDKKLTDVLLRMSGAFAVGDAKAWDRPLDVAERVKGPNVFDNKNPSYQIAFYIQHSGLDWGLLTNGRRWRLYHRDTAHKLNRYYEVDLPALLAADSLDAFLYFYAFFRRRAFEPSEPLGVAALLRESEDFARGVGDSLKRQVYDALRHLAQGFLDYPANGLDATDPATRREIYDNALILLYRLLFILYAEARELLPVREADYRDSYSLYAVKQQVARDVDGGRFFLPSSATRWPLLRELFYIIDKGSPPLKVTTYNGGLFDPQRHPFLERNSVGDAHLQQALDGLARVHDPAAGQRVFVDYRDLSERHLGTIYEGLLEFHLDVLKEPEDGWAVALVNDKGERKATGSYYTPDYIVKYIVSQTVGPVLERAVHGKSTDAEKIAAVLKVNVLDPAMGSGHFLVEATEYIARFLVDLGVAPDTAAAPGEADVAYWKRRVVHSCIYGVDLNPLAVDLAKLSLWLSTLASDRPLSFLDHHLRPGNALVGASLADLQQSGDPDAAKRRAKAAKTVAKQEAAGQLSLLADDTFRQSMSLAVGNMWLIEGSDAQTVAQVKEQEKLYDSLRQSLTAKYGRLADLSCATRFGLRVEGWAWKPLTEFATGKLLTAPPQFARWLREAEAIAQDPALRFFHWELEFPEIFFDKQGRPLGDEAGFEAVIGNPPYIEQERLSQYKPYFASEYGEVYYGTADLYLYFYAQGIRQLQRDGRLGFITSGTFARANFAAGFRKALPGLAQIETFIDFGENQPFQGAEMVRPSIMILHRGEQAGQPFRSLFIDGKIPESLDDAIQAQGIDCEAAILNQTEWTFQSADLTRLFEKVLNTGTPLGQFAGGHLYYGIKTGCNEAFIVDTATRDVLVAADPSCEPLLRKILRGEDLRPWYQEDENRWLIFTRRGVDIDLYPAVKAHLEKFRKRLEPRPDDWDPAVEWPGRKPGSYKWFEIQDSVDYYAEFDKPKLFWPDIAKLPRFSYGDAGLVIGNTGYIMPADSALLGYLQSRVAWFAISQFAQPLRLRAGLWQYRLLPQFMQRLPVPKMTDPDRDALGVLAMKITETARARYTLHQKARHRLRADLGDGDTGKPLNQKLTAWWNLPDLAALRAELGKVYKRDIPVKDRDDWDDWLAARKREHAAFTDTIIAAETELNARVYSLFHLTPDEIERMEESTKYKYGEV